MRPLSEEKYIAAIVERSKKKSLGAETRSQSSPALLSQEFSSKKTKKQKSSKSMRGASHQSSSSPPKVNSPQSISVDQNQEADGLMRESSSFRTKSSKRSLVSKKSRHIRMLSSEVKQMEFEYSDPRNCDILESDCSVEMSQIYNYGLNQSNDTMNSGIVELSKLNFLPSRTSSDVVEEESHPFNNSSQIGINPAQSKIDSDGQVSTTTPPQNELYPPRHRSVVLSAARGVQRAPSLQYGTVGGGSVGYIAGSAEGLAIAIAVSEEEYDEFFPSAIEYDPDQKPPLHKNRRCRLYGFAIASILVISVLAAIIVKISLNKKDTAYFAPTSSPSLSPTTSVEGQYRQRFAALVGDGVFQEGSIYDRTANWIIFEDPMSFAFENPYLDQRFLLSLMYFQTTENESKLWKACNKPEQNASSACLYEKVDFVESGIMHFKEATEATRWLSDTPECQWVGVVCDDVGTVREIDLSGQSIVGQLPTGISQLPYLQVISFIYNGFTGKIPLEYAAMKRLISLELQYNKLTGSFPNELYLATDLQMLNIGANLLTGSITSSVGLLSNLRGFFLFENMLTGSIPTEIGLLSNLRKCTLDLAHTVTNVLGVTGNVLTPSLFIVYTRNEQNMFVGGLPTEFGAMTTLKELWMFENDFTGSIPSELGNTQLLNLRLHASKISGTIPEDFYRCTNLYWVDLYDMSLTGTLSTRVGELQALTSLRIRNNRLTGTIPTELAFLPKLGQLWLHGNEFEGSVPLAICKNVGANFLQVLNADCGPDDNPANECMCCTSCCNRETGICQLMN
jgi:hypothetical protein